MPKYYDEDDLYDYDDYEEEYDESYDNKNQGSVSYHTSALAPSQTRPGDPPSDYVQFVMESLGKVETNATGSRAVGIISEARVLQMLEAYGYDTDATISYFIKQREESKTSVKPKAVAKSVAVPEKQQNDQKTNTKQAASVTGLSSAAPKTEPKLVKTSAVGPASTTASLITSSAYLSDEEYQPLKSNDGKSKSAETPHVTMVVAGHVDAGKSTLVGNLLYKVGNVAQRTMHKFEKESKQSGKGSFALAWVMDESQSEREHGVTIDIAEKQLKTKSKIFTVLDAPGHRDFIPNMISGAAQADTALLVIPASRGEYESSMSSGAQTREHAVLLKALGVSQIIVAVNKMDTLTPSWDQNRFSQIECELRHLLEELQFNPKAIRFVPLSGLTGENLAALSESCALCQWYTGPTLLEAIDTFKDPPRRVDAPLRAVITSVISENAKGCEVSVSVLQGKVRVERGVGLASAAGTATVRRILDHSGESVTSLSAGQKGTLTLIDRSNRTGEEMSLRGGMVICKGPPLPFKSFKFKATLLTMATLQPPIIPGSTFELYLHGEVVQCVITKLYSLNLTGDTATSGGAGKDKSTVLSKKLQKNVRSLGGQLGSVSGTKNRIENPKCIPGGRCAKVKIEVTESVCIEPFKICDALGRFALRSKGNTCAVGICEKVKKII